MNQEQFWTQIGVTQSGGSRYESGREMPRPVKELLRLVHVEQLDLSQVKRVDFEIISYLKESHPDLYRTLRRAVKSRHRHSPDAGVNLAGDANGPGQLYRPGRHHDAATGNTAAIGMPRFAGFGPRPPQAAVFLPNREFRRLRQAQKRAG